MRFFNKKKGVEKMADVKELKSRAYDLFVQGQMIEMELNRINQQIVEEMKPKQEEKK